MSIGQSVPSTSAASAKQKKIKKFLSGLHTRETSQNNSQPNECFNSPWKEQVLSFYLARGLAHQNFLVCFKTQCYVSGQVKGDAEHIWGLKTLPRKEVIGIRELRLQRDRGTIGAVWGYKGGEYGGKTNTIFAYTSKNLRSTKRPLFVCAHKQQQTRPLRRKGEHSNTQSRSNDRLLYHASQKTTNVMVG